MPVPLSYSWRNLATRRLTTALTALGMALVVFVFAATLMLAEGLRITLVSTGSPDNAIFLRKGSETEVQSGVERNQAAILTTRPEAALGQDGRILASRESVVLIGLPRRSTGKLANVVIRGTESASLALRPQVRVTRGRLPRPGASELMAGNKAAKNHVGADLGDTLRFAKREWTVVGVFDAGNSGFSSELWGDVDQLMQAFGRNAYSAVVLRLADPASFPALKKEVEADPRLTAEAYRETSYYEKQSEMMSKFLRFLGVSLTLIFSLGAMIGAMNTMYSSVANRVVEIGTLRALGFSRKSILAAFLLEALFLGLLGGGTGLFLASFLRFVTFSTTNFQTFSELAFRFALTPGITAASLAFAVVMGVGGGVFPAMRAARMNIVEALRSG